MKRTLQMMILVFGLAGTSLLAQPISKDEVKKQYDIRITETKEQIEKLSQKLNRDLEKYGLFHPELAKDYKAMSEAQYTLGESLLAIENALRMMKIEMKLLKEDDPKLAEAYVFTGNQYYMNKQHPTTILYLEKAAQIYGKGGEKNALKLADTYEFIASVYINLDNLEKSLDYARRVLLIRKERLKADDEALQRATMNIDFLEKELKKKQ